MTDYQKRQALRRAEELADKYSDIQPQPFRFCSTGHSLTIGSRGELITDRDPGEVR